MWPLYALLAAVTAAIMTIVGKVGLKGVDPTLATGIRSLFMFIFMTAVVLLTGKLKGAHTLDQKAIWTIAISAIFGALSWLFYFLALRDGSASRVAAIDRTSMVFVIILSTLFLAEKLTWKLALGGLLVAAGAILVAI
jgi:bacterial/archaeal transporter family protein